MVSPVDLSFYMRREVIRGSTIDRYKSVIWRDVSADGYHNVSMVQGFWCRLVWGDLVLMSRPCRVRHCMTCAKGCSREQGIQWYKVCVV
jgi:hypothetical protein